MYKTLLLTSSLCSSLILAQHANAWNGGDYKYRYSNSDNSLELIDFAPHYSQSVIAQAGNEYENYTGINIDYVGNYNFNFIAPGQLAILSGNYGHTGWNAMVIPYTLYNMPCAHMNGGLTNYCNMSTNSNDVRPSIYGYVYLNMYNNPSLNEKQHLIRHEIGHFFGMGHHNYCNAPTEPEYPATSVMEMSVHCRPLYMNLQSQEINWLQAEY
jgi:hypothetical protein